MDKAVVTQLIGVVIASLFVHFLSIRVVRWLQHSELALARWLSGRRASMAEGAAPELYWLHIGLMSIFWAFVVIQMMRLAGYQEDARALMNMLLSAGFDVAGVQLIPVRLSLGILVAVLLLRMTRTVRRKLRDGWRLNAAWDDSANEAMSTFLGYVLIVVSILLGLGVAGFDLSNFAIIAGALSVGLGFGLQNVVSNFVSGLILLSERPVKRGDYIRVGAVEGEVRKIHIRATELETFDRVSVIVPNSELISGAVHNWRFRDPYIRVVIAVGVAYGSDTQRVKELLVELGLAHELTLPLGTPGVPDTHVSFVNFGESSLDFELRTFIRDVNKRGTVASDLRFAIDAAFRKEGIVIPFPQRDVWMQNHVD